MHCWAVTTEKRPHDRASLRGAARHPVALGSRNTGTVYLTRSGVDYTVRAIRKIKILLTKPARSPASAAAAEADNPGTFRHEKVRYGSRRAGQRPVQLRYACVHTGAESVRQRAWLNASLTRCPLPTRPATGRLPARRAGVPVRSGTHRPHRRRDQAGPARRRLPHHRGGAAHPLRTFPRGTQHGQGRGQAAVYRKVVLTGTWWCEQRQTPPAATSMDQRPRREPKTQPHDPRRSRRATSPTASAPIRPSRTWTCMS